MNRLNKIQFLKDLARGLTSVKDLQPKALMIRVGYGSGTQYLVDGEPVTQETYLTVRRQQDKAQSGKGSVSVKVVTYGSDED